MEVFERKIEELIDAEYNPRQLTEKQFKDLSDSLKRLGMIDPVIVNMHPDRKNIIVGGHQRCKVWGALGHKTIPTVEVSFSLDMEREANIRLNKNVGEWDFDELANHFDLEDLEEFGFTDAELKIMEGDDGDDVPPPPSDSEQSIKLKFESKYFDEAKELVEFWEERSADVGMMLLEHLKAEKKKL